MIEAGIQYDELPVSRFPLRVSPTPRIQRLSRDWGRLRAGAE
jgi:hypothetical protein